VSFAGADADLPLAIQRQATFLCTLLSFGRFDLQSGDLVVQLSDFSLQTQIFSGKIVQLRFQGSLVSGGLSSNP
jgi:hypothetical protein